MRNLYATSLSLLALLTFPMRASAADMPVKGPPELMPPARVFSWTGIYVGGNIGGVWTHRDFHDRVFGANFDDGNNAAFIDGGQIGFNYQFPGTSFVLGVEGDFDWAASNSNSVTIVVPTAGSFQVSSKDSFITTVAARFGIAYNNWLFYGKAGGGWVGNQNFSITNVATGASLNGFDNSNSGWLAGGGVEWAFSNNWTAKVEYDFLGLTSGTFTVPVGSPIFGGDTFTTGSNRNVQMVKFGINYLFGWGAISPGY